MVDKYRHLRPRRSRRCYRSDGIPKKRFATEFEAWEASQRRPGTSHYPCSECGFWHFGRDKES